MSPQTSPNKKNTTKWQRFAINAKITKILGALAFLAVLKLTVLGTLGMQAVKGLMDGDLDLPKAMASTPAPENAKGAPATPPAVAPGATAEGDVSSLPASAGSVDMSAQADMLAQTKIPDARVPESQQSRDLNRREAELNARERALTAMEKSIDDKLAELKRVEASLKKLMDDADVLKDARIKRQVDTYAAMKPKQAAEVLSNMEQELAVKILTGMKPKLAGEIMTFVKTDKAAKLTEAMTRVQAPLQGPGK